jgi:hypothetical protein
MVAMSAALPVPPAVSVTVESRVNGRLELPGVETNAKVNDAVRLTVAAKLLMLAKLSDVEAVTNGEPLKTVIVSGAAAKEKSCSPTPTETIVDFEMVPLVPVTVTVKDPEAVPVAAVTVRVEVAVVPSKTDEGLSVAVSADEADSITVPVNPATLLTVIVDITELPGATDRLDGLAATLKVGVVTVTGTFSV